MALTMSFTTETMLIGFWVLRLLAYPSRTLHALATLFPRRKKIHLHHLMMIALYENVNSYILYCLLF
ncbi:hypothetical protein PTKIN_Ptkin14bG0131000 [Pterospermum kingtungense]